MSSGSLDWGSIPHISTSHHSTVIVQTLCKRKVLGLNPSGGIMGVPRFRQGVIVVIDDGTS